MASRHNFRRLEIWKQGISLCTLIYKATETFPNSEIYGLSSQLRRAAVSIPSNISEGTAKGSDKHFVIFLETVLGSAYEVESQLIIASEMEYISEESFKKLEEIIHKLQGMTATFIDKIKQS